MLANSKFGMSMVSSAPRTQPRNGYGGTSGHYDNGYGQQGQGQGGQYRQQYDDGSEDEDGGFHSGGLRPVPSGRSAAAPPPKFFGPSPQLPRMPEPEKLALPHKQQVEHEEEDNECLVLGVAPAPKKQQQKAPQQQPQARPQQRGNGGSSGRSTAPPVETAVEEVLTLGPMSINSPSGRMPPGPPSGRSPCRVPGGDAHTPHGTSRMSGGAGSGHLPAPTPTQGIDVDDWDIDGDEVQQPQQLRAPPPGHVPAPPPPLPSPPPHSQPAPPAPPPVDVDDEPWDSESDEGNGVSPAPAGARAAAAPHVGASWAKGDTGKWEAPEDEAANMRTAAAPRQLPQQSGRTHAYDDPPTPPSAGVQMDRNFADDDWDDDE